MDLLIAFGGALFFNIPLLAVTVTGIAIAVIRRHRHPRVSVVAALGLSAMTLHFLGSAAMTVYTQTAARTAQNPGPFLLRVVILNYGLYLLNVAGIALVTWAIFARRSPSSSVT